MTEEVSVPPDPGDGLAAVVALRKPGTDSARQCLLPGTNHKLRQNAVQ